MCVKSFWWIFKQKWFQVFQSRSLLAPCYNIYPCSQYFLGINILSENITRYISPNFQALKVPPTCLLQPLKRGMHLNMLAAAAAEVSSFSSSCYTPPITSTTNDSLGFVCLFFLLNFLNFDHFTTLCQQLRQQIFIWNMKYLLRFRTKSPEIWKNEELDLKICRPCVTIQHLERSGSVTFFTFITDCFIGITEEILPFHHSPIFPTYRHYWFHNGWMQRLSDWICTFSRSGWICTFSHTNLQTGWISHQNLHLWNQI